MKLFVSLFFLPLVVSAQVDHWESVVQHQDIWSYLVPASEPPSTWKNVNFDDSGWDVGESGIGYGDDDDNTIISPTLSLYIRREFEVVDKAAWFESNPGKDHKLNESGSGKILIL